LLCPSQFCAHVRDGASFLWKNCGSRDLSGSHFPAAKKPGVAARKIARIPLAASLPQDSHMRSMFGAAGLGGLGLSASLSFEFRDRRRGDRAAHRLTCCASSSTDSEFPNRRMLLARHGA
jgi:hypothetical protein